MHELMVFTLCGLLQGATPPAPAPSAILPDVPETLPPLSDDDFEEKYRDPGDPRLAAGVTALGGIVGGALGGALPGFPLGLCLCVFGPPVAAVGGVVGTTVGVAVGSIVGGKLSTGEVRLLRTALVGGAAVLLIGLLPQAITLLVVPLVYGVWLVTLFATENKLNSGAYFAAQLTGGVTAAVLGPPAIGLATVAVSGIAGLIYFGLESVGH